MILAAADYAEDPRNAKPPPELKKAFHCMSFPGALPRAGGLDDQPAGMIERMIQAWNVYTAFQSYRRMERERPEKREEWREDNPELWSIIQRVRKLRDAR